MVEPGRGAQVLLDGDARRAARGTAATTLRGNAEAKTALEIAGLIGDGTTPDGSSLSGLPPEDVVLSASDLVGGSANAGLTFPTLAAAIASPLLAATAFGDVLETGGYYAAGDYGASLYKRVSVMPTHQGRLQAASGGGWWELCSPVINICQFGAKPDGATECRTALQNAYDFMFAKGGGVLHVPPGTFVRKSDATHVRPKSGVILRGAGRNVSTILYDDTVTGTGLAIYVRPTESETDIGFEDLTFRGKLDVAPTGGKSGFQMNNITRLNLRRIGLLWSRGFGFFAKTCANVTATDIEMKGIWADGLPLWDCGDIVVNGFSAYGVSDDCVSAHTADNTVGNLRRNVVIANGVIVESQGIKVLGAAGGGIFNITMERPVRVGLEVNRTFNGQGNTPAHAFHISNVTITDLICFGDTGVFTPLERAYLSLGGGFKTTLASASGGVLLSAGAPGMPDGLGGIVERLNAYRANNTDGDGTAGADAGESNLAQTGASAGGFGLVVSNVSLLRTIGARAAANEVSRGALGLLLPKYGQGGTLYYSGAIAENVLSTHAAVRLDASLSHTLLLGIVSATRGLFGIQLRGAEEEGTVPEDIDNMAFDGVVIEASSFAEFATAGLVYEGALGKAQRVTVRNTSFDGDPFYLSANRAAGNKWAAEAAGPHGADVSRFGGARFVGCDFRNVAAALKAGAYAYEIDGCRVHVQPAAVGFSVNNRGVGHCPAPGEDWRPVIIQGDPTNTAYGSVMNAMPGSAAAMPTTGTWVAGAFVAKTAPAVAAGKVLMGWLRLTTGSAHVNGTDWTPCYTTIS